MEIVWEGARDAGYRSKHCTNTAASPRHDRKGVTEVAVKKGNLFFPKIARGFDGCLSRKLPEAPTLRIIKAFPGEFRPHPRLLDTVQLQLIFHTRTHAMSSLTPTQDSPEEVIQYPREMIQILRPLGTQIANLKASDSDKSKEITEKTNEALEKIEEYFRKRDEEYATLVWKHARLKKTNGKYLRQFMYFAVWPDVDMM